MVEGGTNLIEFRRAVKKPSNKLKETREKSKQREKSVK